MLKDKESIKKKKKEFLLSWKEQERSDEKWDRKQRPNLWALYIMSTNLDVVLKAKGRPWNIPSKRFKWLTWFKELLLTTLFRMGQTAIGLELATHEVLQPSLRERRWKSMKVTVGAEKLKVFDNL